MPVEMVVQPNDLGNEFDIGVIEANKIHVKLDGTTLIRNAGTGVISADPAAIETLTTLIAGATAAMALTYTDENGTANVIDLTAAIQDGETLTSLVAGALAASALTFTDEDGTANVLDLTAAIQDGETTTSLTYNAGTSTLTFTDEDGVVTNIDLSALTTDVYVDGATFNAATMQLTLTDNSGTTPDVVIDLSTLRSSLTYNAGTGVYTHDDGNGTQQTFGPFALSTVTPNLVLGSWQHNDNNPAGATTVDIVSTSADANNELSVGTDGGAYLAAGDIRALADIEVQDTFGNTLFWAFSTNV